MTQDEFDVLLHVAAHRAITTMPNAVTDALAFDEYLTALEACIEALRAPLLTIVSIE